MTTIFLWMPFGYGYYGAPWNCLGWRLGLLSFALGFPVYVFFGWLATRRRAGYWSPQFVGSLLAFLIGLYGLWGALSWYQNYARHVPLDP